ncbi:hypothetical protein TNCV_3236411 [Trichonephila clavipes]|nr:hypothetical protein TNCV_3236411 [Trichonephila clavipes]
MRCIGQGLESLKTFCAVMSLPNPVEQKSHDVINNKLSRVMKEVAEESMKRAAVEENSSSPDNLLKKCAGRTDVDKASGNAGAKMLVKLLELGRLLELDHVNALVSLSLLLTISESLFEVKYVPPTKVTRDV